jgi:hypothetical protein
VGIIEKYQTSYLFERNLLYIVSNVISDNDYGNHFSRLNLNIIGFFLIDSRYIEIDTFIIFPDNFLKQFLF